MLVSDIEKKPDNTSRTTRAPNSTPKGIESKELRESGSGASVAAGVPANGEIANLKRVKTSEMVPNPDIA